MSTALEFANYLDCNPTPFLFVDPGINVAGVSVFLAKFQDREYTFQLLKSDCIAVDKEEMNTMWRVQRMVERIHLYVIQYDIHNIFLEEPPSTIYRPAGKGDIDNVIARAQSIFKTIAVVYGLIGILIGKKVASKIHTFAPLEWEPHHTHRKNMTIKEWSLWHANLVRNKWFPGQPVLKTKKEENEADAINQGYFLLQKLSTGKKIWNP